MRTRISRTTWAALITVAAVGVPSVAWYAAGSHAAEQEAARIEDAPVREARQEAERIARGLAVRLESLRHSEDRRSFLDYQHVHEASDECSCEWRVRSPLARGPADPLVWAHFQIDEVGQLTLPSLAPDRPDAAARDSARRVLSDEHAILEVLECAAEDRLSTLTPKPTSEADEKIDREEGGWIVTVGPFEWHRVSLGHRPALVALRQVSTPAATLAQGFVIRPEALEGLLEDSPFPARLRAGSPVGETDAGIPIEGQPWSVALDASGAKRDAANRAARVRRRFRTLFAGGMLAALLCGGLVVGLVGQAERLARQRVRFAASAAHELRTPLAGLRLYGEMLADEAGDAGRKRSYAGRIAGEAERLGRVVSNLLGFSKLERGDLSLRPTTGNLAAAIRESLGRLAPVLEAGGAKIETSIADALPLVRFDRDAVHQILQNLLDNAARHGGTTHDRTIRVVLDGGSQGPSLSVIDHGPGVPPAVRDKLFRAFVRQRSPDVPDGLGLGLTLVQALARAQGATVVHSDAEGGGSRFTVTFPVAD